MSLLAAHFLHASCTLPARWGFKSLTTFFSNMEHSRPHLSCPVVKNSFLTGLNPLEGFVHSLMTREGSFGGTADVSGTLTRNLMFFMRELYIGYGGTVRNKHGNHVIQFSYASDSSSQDVVGGHPAGSLAVCPLSEAAYSALDQAMSIFEEPAGDCLLKKKREVCITAAIDESSEEPSSEYYTLWDVVKAILTRNCH